MSQFRPGFLSTQAAERLGDTARRVDSLSSSGLGAGVTRAGGVDGQYLQIPDEQPYFWAELTSGPTGTPASYSWREVVQSPEGVWVASGREGAANGYPASKVGGPAPTATSGDVVLMRPSLLVAGTFEFLAAGDGGGSGSGGSSDLCVEKVYGAYGLLQDVIVSRLVVNDDGSADCVEIEPCDCGTTGQIAGTVLRAVGGAAVVGRTVMRTGSVTTTTSAAGYYQFDALAAGSYTATVTLTGGETAEYRVNGGAWVSGATSASVAVVAGEADVVDFRITGP
jgi:hypothetical protein